MFIILKLVFYLYVLSSCSYSQESKNKIDENGYILFCPCMGRFGNQADQFLGVLAFAKGLNRTLVLPPWIEYVPGAAESVQIPFDKYFQVAPLQRFHRVILMHDFMRDIAPTLWPEEKRIVLCYTARYNSDGCNAKHGNPFGPFWDHFGVDFVNSSFYKHLSYDVSFGNHAARWHESYPSKDWPVLAFTGAPSSFPVQKENVHLHQYLQWSEGIHKKAKELIKTFPRGPFVGIHLRNGLDWERACELIEQSPNMFAAPQCLGYMNEKGKATPELCLPSTDSIVKQLKRAIKSVKAKNVFVASDKHYMKDELTRALSKMKINVLTSDGDSPHLDLAVLGLSNHFIGNCISSFSAFVKRERDVMGFPSSFWAFPLVKPKKNSHAEL